MIYFSLLASVRFTAIRTFILLDCLSELGRLAGRGWILTLDDKIGVVRLLDDVHHTVDTVLIVRRDDPCGVPLAVRWKLRATNDLWVETCRALWGIYLLSGADLTCVALAVGHRYPETPKLLLVRHDAMLRVLAQIRHPVALHVIDLVRLRGMMVLQH